MAQSQERQREIKVVSASGQISLGKAFAGETVLVERLEDGQWLVTPVNVIPKHLAWANTPKAAKEQDAFLDWKRKTKLKPTSTKELDQIEKQISKVE